ncbi:MAG TPA: phosphotriesterase-related protein, partial [Firmicutes bacterium]|nr:phosphotriesterase-related protein [Bacillota bacterium]
MKIGRTYIHEHIKLDLSGPKKDPDTNYDDTQGVIEELKELKKQGIDCIVDVTNRGMGRDARILSNVAKQT